MSTFSALSWIRFLRLPAVLTVPGDIWVAAALVGRPFSLKETLAVCFAYLFGMALNDVVDFEADKQNRAERPLPKGEISRKAGVICAVGLAAAAIMLHFSLPLLCLVLAIVSYTYFKNKNLWIGAVLMASCRCLVLWIGAGGGVRVAGLWPLFALWGYLIFMITLLADKENRPSPVVLPLALGLTFWWLAAPGLSLVLGQWVWWICVPWALLAYLGFKNFRFIFKTKKLSPQNTGIWLSMLMPLQSIFLFAFGVPSAAIALFLGWFLLKWGIRKMQIS